MKLYAFLLCAVLSCSFVVEGWGQCVAKLKSPSTGFKNCQSGSFTVIVSDDNSTPVGNITNYKIIWGNSTSNYNSSVAPASIGNDYLPGIYDLKYIITTNEGCIDTTNYAICNISAPNAGASSTTDATACIPGLITMNVVDIGANHSSTVYTVDWGDGSPIQNYTQTGVNAIPSQISHTYSESSCGKNIPQGNTSNLGQYIFVLKAIGCCDTKIVEIKPIKIYKAPQPNFSINTTPSCINIPVTFTNLTIEGINQNCTADTKYIWDFGDGTIKTVFDKSPQTHTYLNESINNTNGNNYEVTLTASPLNTAICAPVSITKPVKICKPPASKFKAGNPVVESANCANPTIAIPTTICPTSVLALTDISSLSVVCDDTFLWEVTSPSTGYLFSTGGTTSTAQSPSITFSLPGTYTIRQTVTNFCDTSTSCMIVTIKDGPPPPTITGLTSPYCEPATVDFQTQSTTDASQTYQWTIIGVNGTANPTPPANANTFNPDAMTLPAGSYNIKVKVENTCGKDSTNQNILVKPLPTVSISGLNEACMGATNISFSATATIGSTYQWQKDGTNIGGATNQTYMIATVNASHAGKYRVVVTLNGCPKTSNEIDFKVNPLPNISISANKTAYCAGETINTSFSSNAPTASTYQWFLDNVPITGATSASLVATQTGSYKLQVVDSKGCVNVSNVITITTATVPTASITGNSVFCTGGSVTLTAETNLSGVTYQWKKGGVNIPSANGVTLIVSQAGNYTVLVTAGICSALSGEFQVTENPLPDATITGAPLSFCAGGSVKLQANIGTGLSYKWYKNNVLESTTVDFYDATASGTYKVEVTNQFGCKRMSADKIVTVYPYPTVTVLPTAPAICEGVSVTLTANALPTVGTTYQWIKDNVDIAGATNASHTTTIAGAYRVKVTSNGCSTTSDGVNVLVNAYPTAMILADDEQICTNEFTSITATTNATSPTYKWFRGTTVLSETGATLNNVTEAGIYKVEITANGCTKASNTVTITVNSLPTATIAGTPQVFCEGTAISANLTANTGTGLTYQWIKNGADIAGAINSTYTATTVGAYKVRIINANACVKVSDSLVISTKPFPTASITGNLVICNGQNTTLTANDVAGATYQWTLNGTNMASQTNKTLIASSVGEYRVVITLAGCATTSDPKTLVVYPLPDAVIITASPTTFCEGGNVTLQASQGIGLSYQWFKGTTLIPNETASSYVATASGTYKVRVKDANGCEKESEGTVVSVTLNPIVSISPMNPAICSGTAIALTASPASGAYQWSLNGVPISGATQATYSATLAGTYKVVVTVNNCSAKDSTIVTVNELPTVDITSTDKEICQGEITFITATSNVPSAVYKWTRNGMVLVGEVGSTLNNIAQGGEYKATVVLSGCEKVSEPVIITLHPLPIITTGGNVAVCKDNAPFLLAGYSSNGAGSNYSFSGSGITNNTTGEFNPQATGVVIGINPITIEFIDAVTGCKGNAIKNVIVNSLPIITFGTIPTYCKSNNTINLTALDYSPKTGATGTGVWSGASVNNNQFNLATATVGSNPIVYNFTDLNGCQKTDTTYIQVIVAQVVEAGENRIVCADAGTITLTGYTPTGGTWTGSSLVNGNQVNVSALSIGTHTFKYSVGTGTCTVSDSITIKVNPLPIVNAGGLVSVCIDKPTFPLAGITTNGMGTNYTFSGVGIVDVVAGTFNASQAGAGTHTITITFTDSETNCIGIATKNVEVKPLPTIDLSAVPTVYCKQSVNINLTQYAYTPQTGGTGTWSGAGIVGNIFNPFNAGVGTHSLIYKFTNTTTTCENADTIQVVVQEPATVEIGNRQTTCIDAGNVPLFSATPVGGVWTGAGVSFVGGSYVLNTTTAGVGVHIVTYTYGTGSCQVIKSKEFEVYALPVMEAGTNQAFCVYDASVTLTGYSPTTNGMGIWSGNGVTANGIFSPTNAGVGTHTLTYTFTSNITNCTNTDTKQIIVHPKPLPAFLANEVYCVNQPITFTNTTPVPAGYSLIYSWDFGDNTPTTNTLNGVHTYTVAGNYTLTLRATTVAGGCTDIVSKPILIVTPPQAIFNVALAPNTACGPVTAQFTNTSTAFNPLYFWDFGNGTTSNLPNPPLVVYPANPYKDTLYIATLRVDNLCGSKTFKDTILVKPSPTAKFVFEQDTICSGYLLKLYNYSFGKVQQSEWDFGDGSPILTTTNLGFVQHAFIYTGTTSKTFYIKLKVSNDCGTSTFTDSLVVVPKIVTSFFGVDTNTGCAPLTVNFQSNQIAGFNDLIWIFGDGETVTTRTGVAQTHIYQNAGIYTAKLIVKNSCHIDTSQVIITVLQNPIASFTSPTEVCVGKPIIFTNTSPTPFGSVWDFGDGTTSNLAQPPAKIYAAVGEYVVKLTETHPTTGCKTSFSKTIKVNPKPKADFSMPLNGCVGLPVSFQNLSTGATNYFWSFDSSGILLSAENPSHIFSTVGIFTVKLIAVNDGLCGDTISKLINILPKPAPNFVGKEGCSPLVVEFENLTSYPPASGGTFYWNFGNGNTYTGFDGMPPQTYINNTPETIEFTVWLKAVSNLGCADSVKRIVKVFPTPIADFKILAGDTLCSSNATTKFQNLTLPAERRKDYFYTWDFDDGSPISNLFEPTHTFERAGIYDITLKVRTSEGCQDSIVKTLTVLHGCPNAVHYPNAFTPNEDKVNDYFKPITACVAEYEFAVFNQWGIEIYRTSHREQPFDDWKGWDGKYKGQDMPEELYVYVSKLTCTGGKKADKRGEIFLMRK